MVRLAHHSYTTPRRALCILLFPFFDLCANCEHAPEVRRHRRSSFPSSRARALLCLPPLLLQARTNFVPPPLRCPQNGTPLLPPCGIHTLPSAPRRTSLGRRVHSSPYWRPPGAPSAMPKASPALNQRCVHSENANGNVRMSGQPPPTPKPKAPSPKCEFSRIPPAPR